MAANARNAVLQPRRCSARQKVIMRGRAEMPALRTSLYKRGYFHGSRSEVMTTSEQFVRACENGDYRTVHRMLEANQITNIDVINQLGRTAMQLAIENEHLEIVLLLLEKCEGQKLVEALLLAIYLGHIQIAEACILHSTFKKLNERGAINNDDTFWQTPSSDDAQFAPDITPLILAAQYNRTEIVQLLLRSGNRITKPHDYHCKCLQCHQKFKFDSLRHAQSRLNAYRGLASESYISLASIDPILTAFELGRELRDLSSKEKYFKNEYMILADQLSAYAVKLLDKVRGHKELDCVLGKTGKESEEKYELLARLYLAIKYEEKPFVAHSNCQQKLVEIWHSQIRNVSKLNPLLILLLTIVYIFILPFACVLYILTSWSRHTIKFQRFLKQPCIKFIGHTISYAVFIILIIVSSFLFAGEFNKKITRLKDDKYLNISIALNRSIEKMTDETSCIIYPNDNLAFRAATPTLIDIAISVFVVGFLWHEIKQAYSDGFQDYLLSWNNIVDSCMNILYLSSFTLKYYVIGQVNVYIRKLDEPQFREDVWDICSLNKTRQWEIYNTFYWLNADRFHWMAFDPINVAEGLFAIANIFSFSRICFLLPAFQHLGPLQISLGRMMSDIGKFIIIFLIIFCGFMFGLNNLFWYYKESVRKNVEVEEHLSNTSLPAEEFFGTMDSTFKTVFWSLFGLAEKEGVHLEHYNKGFTEMVGYIIYGAFNIASVIVLLNMLIAMMSKSYESIEEHADVEWKFARSKLYMEYIKEGGTLPVPFNIIPTPKDVYYFVRRMFACMKRLTNPAESKLHFTETSNIIPLTIRINTPNPTVSNSKSPNVSAISNGRVANLNLQENNFRSRQGSFDSSQRLTYAKVMNRVIKRFLLHKQREEQEEIREGDFEELKQDIQMLRFEMLNRLEETRDDLLRNTHLLNEGVVIVGELLSSFIYDSNPLIKENFHIFKSTVYSRTDSGIESNRSTGSTISMSNVSSTYAQELNHQPGNCMKQLSLAHVGLQQIVEEEEIENIEKSLPFIDDEEEEEVSARHMSIQTSADDDKTNFSRF